MERSIMQHLFNKIFNKNILIFTLLFSILYLYNYSYASNITSAEQTKVEKIKIESIIHNYIISNPEIILEAMQALQNKQIEQAKKTIKITEQDAPRYSNDLFSAPQNLTAGNPNGSITLVEFFDYQCPHCVEAGITIDTAIKNNNNLRVIYKEWPIRGPLSEFASRAAIAAADQNKYLPLHQALLATKQPLTEENIINTAKNLGLNIAQLKQDMDSAKINKIGRAHV